MYFTWPKINFLFAYSNDDTSEFSSYSKHGSNLQGDHYYHSYEVTSGLVPFLIFTVSSQISIVLPLRSLFFKVFNIKFQIFPVFVPKIPAGFTSYTTQIILINSAWILYILQFNLASLDKK